MKYVIGKNVIIGANVKIGHGAIIADDVILGDQVNIGNYTIIDDGCIIGNDTNIGDHTKIKRRTEIGSNTSIDCMVSIAGKVRIGNKVQIHQLCNIANGSLIENRVFIGPGVIFANTRRISYGRGYPAKREAPVVRWGVRIGSQSMILPEVELGTECLIGAGSVVTKSTKPKWIYYGNPAQAIKPVPENELYPK